MLLKYKQNSIYFLQNFKFLLLSLLIVLFSYILGTET
jgi:hypothetical protein